MLAVDYRPPWCQTPTRSLARLVRSLALLGSVMECAGAPTANALAFKDFPIRRYDDRSGPKTSDTYACIWNGEHIASETRVSEWSERNTKVRNLAESNLFLASRIPDQFALPPPEDEEVWLSLRTSEFVLVDYPWDRSVARIAALGSWDAVEFLWTATNVLYNLGRFREASWSARHLGPALARLARYPSGERVAILLLAMMRKALLDSIGLNDQWVDFSSYNLPRHSDLATFPSPHILSTSHGFFVDRELIVETSTLEWIASSLPKISRSPPRAGWEPGRSPIDHLKHVLHPRALDLIKSELGEYAESSMRATPRRRGSLRHDVIASSMGVDSLKFRI